MYLEDKAAYTWKCSKKLKNSFQTREKDTLASSMQRSAPFVRAASWYCVWLRFLLSLSGTLGAHLVIAGDGSLSQLMNPTTGFLLVIVSVYSHQDAFLPTPSPWSLVPKFRSSDDEASSATRPDVLAALTGAQVEQCVPFFYRAVHGRRVMGTVCPQSSESHTPIKAMLFLLLILGSGITISYCLYGLISS